MTIADLKTIVVLLSNLKNRRHKNVRKKNHFPLKHIRQDFANHASGDANTILRSLVSQLLSIQEGMG
jgi:hypothetical protein